MKSVKAVLKSNPGTEVSFYGWVKFIRNTPNLLFLVINDGSCQTSIQCVLDKKGFDQNFLAQLSLGEAVYVEGLLVDSPAAGQPVEVNVSNLKKIGFHDIENYPIQKKQTTLEFLREILHLRPRTNTLSASFRIRSSASFAIHKFFQERGFFYIHTPIITASDCEGAGEMFRVTTLSDLQRPEEDFFGKPVYLTVSGQLEAEALALALGKVYTFGPTFRAENSNTTRHLAEFWMIEPEMAFYDLEMTISLATQMLKFLTEFIITHNQDDLEWLTKFTEVNLLEKLENFLRQDPTIVSYTEAVEILKNSGRNFEFPPDWGHDLQTEHEKYLLEHFGRAVVVTHYPKEIKAFYMKLDEDNKTVKNFDYLLPGVGEVIGGSQREDNYQVLLNRIRDLGLKEDDYRWYLDLRRFGSVFHSGFGLGLERFLLFVTELKNVRDVIPFPRTPGNITV